MRERGSQAPSDGASCCGGGSADRGGKPCLPRARLQPVPRVWLCSRDATVQQLPNAGGHGEPPAERSDAKHHPAADAVRAVPGDATVLEPVALPGWLLQTAGTLPIARATGESARAASRFRLDTAAGGLSDGAHDLRTQT